jgi:hypothetical protein
MHVNRPSLCQVAFYLDNGRKSCVLLVISHRAPSIEHENVGLDFDEAFDKDNVYIDIFVYY